ncbi:glycosyl transferase [Methylopila turkensis]|uniref:Glycosyl transferase n=1 Tax=Methylopila turkensis TaxID=1437816 RepID=A0A9W6N7K5_9HYPH|nr:glycosyl transferase [Methylopila turkensis]
MDEAVLRLSPRPEGVQVGVPVLPHGLSESAKILAQRQLVENLLAGLPTTRRIFWYYTPMALLFSRHLDADVTVFDNMDQLSAFRGAPPELIALEDEMLAKADVVFTGGHSLYEAKKHRHDNIHAFPSSIDVAHFGQGRNGGAEPADQAGIPGPRIGFFGVIDERMDTALVGEVARLRPDWSFVMLGPVVKIDPAELPQRPNLHWLGGKPYAELPAYVGGWDAGFMPFALNESTRFISPTKTPEFLAAGVPVASTPIVDVIGSYGEAGLVEIAGDAQEMVSALERLMAADRAPWLARVDAKLSENSWDQTFARIYELTAEAADRKRAARGDAPLGKESAHV